MKNNLSILVLLPLVITLVSACNKESAEKVTSPVTQDKKSSEGQINKIWPVLNFEVKKSDKIEKEITRILSTMTLEQKVAQMIQPEIRDITVEDMRKYGFGSYLNGGGAFPNNNKHSTPADWIKLAEDMYQASIDDSLDGINIPTIWGTDAVHGHNNVIGATLFPHNIALGAANNSDLIEKIAKVTATEVMVTGIDWVFAPTVAVVRDDRWGRTYEGYSEDPEIVRNYAAAIVKGLQGHADGDFLGEQRVISTVKHFLGDGGTQGGDDQGDNIDSEQALFKVHGQGYVGGLSAGAQSVMASFNSWHGVKNHGNKHLLTDVLKTQMGFDGFVVGDWNGHGQIKGCTNENCPQAINAGLDIFMVPTNAWKPLYENTIAQVNSGVISLERINDAVSRILRVKLRADLFNKPSPANRAFSGKTELIGAAEHREIARQAVRESLVLLKNKNQILPLNPHQNILITGDGADNIGKQSGGWTITWQGTGNNNSDFPGGSSIFDGFKEQLKDADGQIELSSDGNYKSKPDVAIVVFGEDPYAEGNGDIDNLDFQRGDKRDLALIKKLKAQGIPVVSVFLSGRPLWVNAELNASDAFVAAWLPGSEGAGIAEVLLRKGNGEIAHDFKGKLSYSWPATPNQTSLNRFDDVYKPLLPYGFGLQYGDKNILPDDLNEILELTSNTVEFVRIFDRNPQKPWTLLLSSGKSSTAVNTNVQTLGAITLRTEDKMVQEDARILTFDGSDKAGVRFQGNFPEDLRATLENKSALQFNVKVVKKPSSKVNISMLCEGSCGSNIDVTDHISTLSNNEWHSMSIDLACFKKTGTDISKVISPFELSTSGTLVLSLADIAIVQNTAEQATISCQ